jgi:hypothetical protein
MKKRTKIHIRKRKTKDEILIERARQFEKHRIREKILDVVICFEVIFITFITIIVTFGSYM